ncbi:probable protein S-acyltransferase 15 isoform X2 [Cucurbita moschata]|uniref:S-acyltransferase n=1 Tax=Cucurbita moschata TaxID=3662 RepID=A0A6J1GN76_CUCMO|nr:probable protein S-acyltransferase 15 isoform X2 [Cucurbita moschata]
MRKYVALSTKVYIVLKLSDTVNEEIRYLVHCYRFVSNILSIDLQSGLIITRTHIPSFFISRALQVRHCEKCSTYKPPRTHHCRVCRKCVLRMDHHCLWINNCVGYWNYKSFFVLVSYGTLASLYSTFIIMRCAFQKNWNFEGMLPVNIFYVICAVMMISLSSTLGTLLGWHIYLIVRNMTTIEYYEGIRAAWLARKSGQSYQHPFDVGAYKNTTLILGPNILKWAWPTSASHLKDGLSFPTLRDSS